MSNPVVSEPLSAAHAHWTIYLPSLVVALVWAGVYLIAVWHQPVLEGLRALALAVEGLIVPILLFFAAVRARVLTAEMRDEGTRLYVRSGFFRPQEISIGVSEIATVRVRRSLPQRFFGGGALDIKTLSGERVFVSDLDRPGVVAAALVSPRRAGFGRVEILK
jgi:uncharacterized membrane protein YdbT with pleckstrin-like domain